MATTPKKTKRDKDFTVTIRVCDSFYRTPEDIICSFIKARESVRILYILQERLLISILRDEGEKFGLAYSRIKWIPLGDSKRDTDGNIFIEYTTSQPFNEEDFELYKLQVETELRYLGIRRVLLHHMGDESTVSQPLISDIDYKIHELKLLYESLLERYRNSEAIDPLPIDLQSIQEQLLELQENRFSVGVLSHNDVGKSYVLNLLLLLTAENNEECQETRKIILPRDIPGNPTVKMVKEDHFADLPEVIKDFLIEINDEEQYFKSLVTPVCHELSFSNHEELRRIENSFSTLSGYYTEEAQVNPEPYLLPQKGVSEAYLTTTKCIFHLRYGTSFQMKVDYFDEKELQIQLFELVSLNHESEEIDNDIFCGEMKNKAQDSLNARFVILTNYLLSENDKRVLKQFTQPDDIRLCDVKEFAGKTELYIGKGENAAEDRLALTKLLNDFILQSKDGTKSKLLRKKIAAIKSIVVYLPSFLLFGGKEILEMPGTDDSDPLAMNFIQEALDTVDAVFVLSDCAFNNTTLEVKDALKNSEFIKNWIENSQNYKLMFLCYPEKDQNFKFGKNDQANLEKLLPQENRKKVLEMKRLRKVIHPNLLSPLMKNNIFSSSILPVLHTSIHAQKGIPHEIIDQSADIVKHTGINKLFIELDKCVIQKQTFQLEKIKINLKQLQKQLNETNTEDEMSDETISQDINFTNESDFLKKNEDLYNNLKKDHEDIISYTVNGQLKDALFKSAIVAMKKWTEIESKVRNPGVFNPQYIGKNSTFKVKIQDIFGDLDENISPIFYELIDKLTSTSERYKAKAIMLFNEELHDKRGPNEASIERSLEYAISWHLGQRRSGLNEGTLKKCFKNSYINSFTNNILEPANRRSIETTKSKMGSEIQKTLEDVKSLFLKDILSLYNNKWPLNLARFMVRACISLKSIHNSKPGCTFCGEIRCSTCLYVNSTSTFQSSTTEKVYDIMQSLSCLTMNAIYLITCKKCKKQYVGETTRTVRRRFVDHLSRISCRKDMALPQHFSMDGHSKCDIALVIIEQVKDNENILERETYWIDELKTLKPGGLNSKV